MCELFLRCHFGTNRFEAEWKRQTNNTVFGLLMEWHHAWKMDVAGTFQDHQGDDKQHVSTAPKLPKIILQLHLQNHECRDKKMKELLLPDSALGFQETVSIFVM